METYEIYAYKLYSYGIESKAKSGESIVSLSDLTTITGGVSRVEMETAKFYNQVSCEDNRFAEELMRLAVTGETSVAETRRETTRQDIEDFIRYGVKQ